MKDKKSNKSSKLGGKKKKKMTTAEAIAIATSPKSQEIIKKRKLLKDIREEIDQTVNKANSLGELESEIIDEESFQIPNIIVEYGKYSEDISLIVNKINKLDDKLTSQELNFINLRLSGGLGTIDAMKLAGYSSAHDSYLFLLAKKITERYESQVEDHRIIARAVGAGEVFVIKGLMDLAKNSPSGIVKRAALADLAKILGLTKETLEGAGGITLIFEGQGAGQVQVVGPGAPPLPATPAALPAPTSTKPMMITK